MNVRWFAALTVAMLAAASVGGVARAQDFPENPLIQQGVQLYNDLEYEASVDALQRALVRAENVPEQKVAIFKFLALDYLVLGRQEDARQAFRQLLAIQPEFQLDPAVFSPEYRQFLEGVRAEWEGQGRPGWVSPQSRLRPATIDHRMPDEAVRGESLDLQATVEDPDGRVRRFVVAYRSAGQSDFARMEAQATSTGYAATIAGDRVEPPVIEYFFEVLDDGNNVVGRKGDERTPLRVPVPSGEDDGSWYTSWWFWTIVGVGVAAAVAVPVGIVYGTSGESNDPASVTIILCDPEVPGDCGP
ncbi:MAG: tetratricopeptide repeat protein [Deltaproteobacteria bacterium]|nr:tetratricopeptide repeat protein [Deltaproteobacteria bacterium]